MSRRFMPYVAPTLLAAIALLQVHAATTGSLSAWKGGGFGMFSTIDSPGSRFVRVYVQTSSDRAPVQVPRSLAPLERELRAIPSSPRLEELAQRLGEGTWVSARFVSAYERYRERWLRYQGNSAAEGTGRTDTIPAVDGTAAPVTTYRMLDEPGDSGEIVSVERIDLEVWQLRFDRANERLVSRRILATSSRRP